MIKKIYSFFLLFLFFALFFRWNVFAQSTYQATACDADINQSGIVDLSDYSLLVTHFFETEPNPPRVDINSDGMVDLTDYSYIVRYFFQTCSPTNTPVPTISIAPPTSCKDISGVILVQPGEDIQSKVSANSEGSTFCILTGVHRMQSINPKKNQQFIGEKGTVLNGSKLLTEFTKEGSYWVASNQTQESTPAPVSGDYPVVVKDDDSWNVCADGIPRCNRNEQLFINDEVYTQVVRKEDIVAGSKTWFFDYPNNKIYFGVDPTGKKVEASVTQNAFVTTTSSSATNILVSNLVIEKYASGASNGAISLDSASNIVEFSEVRLNHGTGVDVGNNGIVRNNYIHHQGQRGVSSNSSNVIFENNEIAFNNNEGFNMGWDAGGSKWDRTTNLVVRNNYAHDNNGAGLWTDIDNKYTTYDGNISVRNKGGGISHEISFEAEIKNNFLADNFRDLAIWNSAHVDIFNNIFVTNATNQIGIMVYNYNRGYSGKYSGEAWRSEDIDIYQNKVYAFHNSRPIVGFIGSSTDPAPWDYDTTIQSLRYRNNMYYVQSDSRHYWRLTTFGTTTSDFTLEEFQDRGQDIGSTKTVITSASQVPVIPSWNVLVGPQ